MVIPGLPPPRPLKQQEGSGGADGGQLQHNSSNSSSLPSGMVPVQGFSCGGNGSSLLGMVPVSGMCLGPQQQQQQHGNRSRPGSQQQQRDQQHQALGSVPGLLSTPGVRRRHQEQQPPQLVLGMGMDVEMLDDAGSPLHLANHSQPQARQRKQVDLPVGALHADDMQQQPDQGQRSLLRRQQQPGVEEDEENGLLLLDLPRCMPTPASPVHHPLEDCGLLGAAAGRGAGQGAAGGLLQGAGSPGVSDDVLTALALEEPLQDLLQGGLEAAEVSVWVRGAWGNGTTSTAWLCWQEGYCCALRNGNRRSLMYAATQCVQCTCGQLWPLAHTYPSTVVCCA